MDGRWGGLLRKARGILGLGAIGGVAGLVAGGVVGFIEAVLRVGFFLDAEYWLLLLRAAVAAGTYYAQPAAFAAVSFGVLLAAADRRRSLVELPMWRMALFGALGGAAFFPLIVVVRLGLTPFIDMSVSVLSTIGVFAGAGGLLAATLTAVAKKAHRDELRLVRDLELLSRPE